MLEPLVAIDRRNTRLTAAASLAALLPAQAAGPARRPDVRDEERFVGVDVADTDEHGLVEHPVRDPGSPGFGGTRFEYSP
jgi:hypothetical protein